LLADIIAADKLLDLLGIPEELSEQEVVIDIVAVFVVAVVDTIGTLFEEAVKFTDIVVDIAVSIEPEGNFESL